MHLSPCPATVWYKASLSLEPAQRLPDYFSKCDVCLESDHYEDVHSLSATVVMLDMHLRRKYPVSNAEESKESFQEQDIHTCEFDAVARPVKTVDVGDVTDIYVHLF